MAYHLKLTKGRSYYGLGGKLKATSKQPDVFTEDKATADAAVASGYFTLVGGDAAVDVKFEDITPEQIDTMKVDALKRIASQLNIDIKGLTKKDEIAAAIKEALAQGTTGDCEDSSDDDDAATGTTGGDDEDADQ